MIVLMGRAPSHSCAWLQMRQSRRERAKFTTGIGRFVNACLGSLWIPSYGYQVELDFPRWQGGANLELSRVPPRGLPTDNSWILLGSACFKPNSSARVLKASRTP